MDEMWQAEMWEEAQDRWYDEEDMWSDPAECEDEPAEWDAYVLSSAGWGTDEDYGSFAPDPWA